VQSSRPASLSNVVLRSSLAYSLQPESHAATPDYQKSSGKLRVRALSSDSSPVEEMPKAIRVHKAGGPEELQWEDVELSEPGEGEVRIKHTVVGLNFIDVYFRKGIYPPPGYPFIPGMEAAGVVTAVGPGLTGCKVGDRVAYAGGPWGHMQRSD